MGATWRTVGRGVPYGGKPADTGRAGGAVRCTGCADSGRATLLPVRTPPVPPTPVILSAATTGRIGRAASVWTTWAAGGEASAGPDGDVPFVRLTPASDRSPADGNPQGPDSAPGGTSALRWTRTRAAGVGTLVSGGVAASVPAPKPGVGVCCRAVLTPETRSARPDKPVRWTGRSMPCSRPPAEPAARPAACSWPPGPCTTRSATGNRPTPSAAAVTGVAGIAIGRPSPGRAPAPSTAR